MRNLIILALFSLVLMGCQTPPPVYSTTYNFYDQAQAQTAAPAQGRKGQ